MTTAPHIDNPTIDVTTLRAYPTEVRKTIRAAVNDHHVAYRTLPSNHLRLYSGDRDVSPIKISASRPAEHTLRHLLPWLEANIPTWVTVPAPTLVDASPAEAGAAPEAEEAPADGTPDGWRDVGWGFLTDGTVWRCTQCDHTQAHGRGVHLHARIHKPDEIREAAAKTAVTKARRREEAKTALTVLARQVGLEVVEQASRAEERQLERYRTRLAQLERRLAKVTEERDEARARLDLMRDALKA